MSGDDLERIRQTLETIRGYCERIALHMHRFGGKDEFLKDWAYQDACVMILGQIGEESKKISNWLTANSDYNWRDVIRFRDFIYHAYSRTEYNVVWEIISRDIPELLNATIELLDLLDSDGALMMARPKRKGLFGGRR